MHPSFRFMWFLAAAMCFLAACSTNNGSINNEPTTDGDEEVAGDDEAVSDGESCECELANACCDGCNWTKPPALCYECAGPDDCVSGLVVCLGDQAMKRTGECVLTEDGTMCQMQVVGYEEFGDICKGEYQCSVDNPCSADVVRCVDREHGMRQTGVCATQAGGNVCVEEEMTEQDFRQYCPYDACTFDNECARGEQFCSRDLCEETDNGRRCKEVIEHSGEACESDDPCATEAKCVFGVCSVQENDPNCDTDGDTDDYESDEEEEGIPCAEPAPVWLCNVATCDGAIGAWQFMAATNGTVDSDDLGYTVVCKDGMPYRRCESEGDCLPDCYDGAPACTLFIQGPLCLDSQQRRDGEPCAHTAPFQVCLAQPMSCAEDDNPCTDMACNSVTDQCEAQTAREGEQCATYDTNANAVCEAGECILHRSCSDSLVFDSHGWVVEQRFDVDCDGHPNQCNHTTYDATGCQVYNTADEGCDGVVESCNSMTCDEWGWVSTQQVDNVGGTCDGTIDDCYVTTYIEIDGVRVETISTTDYGCNSTCDLKTSFVWQGLGWYQKQDTNCDDAWDVCYQATVAEPGQDPVVVEVPCMVVITGCTNNNDCATAGYTDLCTNGWCDTQTGECGPAPEATPCGDGLACHDNSCQTDSVPFGGLTLVLHGTSPQGAAVPSTDGMSVVFDLVASPVENLAINSVFIQFSSTCSTLNGYTRLRDVFGYAFLGQTANYAMGDQLWGATLALNNIVLGAGQTVTWSLSTDTTDCVGGALVARVSGLEVIGASSSMSITADGLPLSGGTITFW